MGTMSKSPGKMVHDFCIQAKVEDATSNWLVMDVRRMMVAKKDGSTKNLPSGNLLHSY